MATATKTKTRQRIFQKSYERLVRDKKRVDGALQLLIAKQRDSLYAGREALLSMARLKIKGGPHDLSGRLRDYLYGL